MPSQWDVVHTQAVIQVIIQSAAINIVHRSDDLVYMHCYKMIETFN